MGDFAIWLEDRMNEVKWIQKLHLKKGALNAAAEAAGKSKSEYCKSPPSGLAAKRCNLWKVFKKAEH